METSVKGRCHFCSFAAKVERHCVTCEKITAKHPTHVPFSCKACRKHGEQALIAVKRHALTAHPSNLLRATVAALRGEDIE